MIFMFSKKNFLKNSICERERKDFIEKNVFLEKQVHDLVEVKNSLEGKIAKLELELSNANETFKKMNAGSIVLDDMLSLQKASLARTELGYACSS